MFSLTAPLAPSDLRARHGRLTVVIVASVFTFGAPAGAQVATRPPSDSVRLFTRRDGAAVIGIAVAVAAIMPVDRSIATAFQRGSLQSNGGLRGSSNVFNGLADPGTVVFSAVTYFVGIGAHSRPIASLGMHTGEAIVMGGVLAELIKGAVGRARPSVSPADSRDFHSWKGFGNDNFGSFPSGEATAAFATATMASREVGRSWPRASPYVTTASFAAATLVGVARLYRNQHWASDVVAGAGLGTLSAVLFDRYNQKYPDNIFNRVFLPGSVVPSQRGVVVGWAIPVS